MDQLTGAQLRALYKAGGREFSDSAWTKIQDDTIVGLHRCASCGFEFFDPALAGDEQFYGELDDSSYYSCFRPEFPRAVALAKSRGLRRVLDVGCGRGDFLKMARDQDLETYGLELNAVAAEKARACGHRIFANLLHELKREDTGGGFDMITLFQVLEHVSSPPSLLRQAFGFLNPGGVVVVAVPAARGILRLCRCDPGNWPPHHVSRWTNSDFQTLARTSGLRLLETGADVLLGSDIEFVWNMHNQLAPVIGRTARPGGRLVGKLLSFVYRKAGLKLISPPWGRSIYAYFTATEEEL